MANAFIGFANLADETVFGGGSYQPTLPASNLANRQLALVARTTDLAYASTVIDFELPDIEQVRAFALANHNMTQDALYRLTLAETSALTSPAYQSDVELVWPGAYRTEDLDFESPNWWSGQYLARELASTTPLLPIILPAPAWVRFGRLEIFDQGNPAGFVQYGRPFVGSGWTPRINMLGGASIGVTTDTVADKSASGALFFDRKLSKRRVRFTIDHMDSDEAMTEAFELNRQMGIDGEVLFCWDPTDAKFALQRTFLGHLPDLQDVEFAWESEETTRATAPITCEELV